MIERVLELAPGLVVVDEAYGQFAPSSALELGAVDNLVVVRTFSKTWSLAALRLGYAIAAPEVVEALFAVTLPYHLDALKQAAGRIALDYVDDMNDRVRRLVAERERLLAALGARLGRGLSEPGELHLVPRAQARRAANEVWDTLVEPLGTRARRLELRRPRGLPAGHRRNAEENDAFLSALDAVLASGS